MTLAQHMCESNEWGTPLSVIQKVYELYGEIDLDPSSSEFFNKNVKAKKFYTKEEDGLNQIWLGNTVFINPPSMYYGKKGAYRLFWDKANLELREGNIRNVVFMLFSLEQLQTLQNGRYNLLLNSYVRGICIPFKRLHYISENINKKPSPTHGSAIINLSVDDNTEQFLDTFKYIGGVVSLVRRVL